MEVLDFLKKRKEDFPRYAAANIILKLMNALYYTHNEVKYERRKKSIIHCDIKPSNIILSAKDYKIKKGVDKEFVELVKQNKAEPYLIDFGIAKFKGESKQREGTINYLSPAQLLENPSKIDWRTDTYQLLLVYHEMLTKKKPYSNMSKNKIISDKLTHNFEADKKITSSVRELIEKGTRIDSSNSFKTEKECIKAMSQIESRQKVINRIKKYKKPAIISLFIILLLFAAHFTAIIWDKEVKSTDALIKKLEQNPNPSIQELELTIKKIQKRAFEKKYYQPLIKGEFRDKKTGKPMYPSHLNVNGDWILVGPETEEAGTFAGLLFDYASKYPDKYPYLEDYAKEYTEPIFSSEFDGTAGKRFMYALIPAYEHTGDKKYLDKLVNVSNHLISDFNGQKGITQCDDLYYTDLFLFVYEKTGERRYLEFFDGYVRDFIKNNIDSDGYVYMFASVNASSPYGDIPDTKAGWRIVSTSEFSIGIPVELNENNANEFKSIAGMYTKDYIEIILTIDKIYDSTRNFEYYDSKNTLLSYYMNNSEPVRTDYIFISSGKNKNEIPRDSLSTIKAIELFQKYDNNNYYNKLRNFVSNENFKTENEKGIIRGNVYVAGINYANAAENNKNQTTIFADASFLELSVEN
jgi:serine/threonine protein kinase